LRKYFLIPCFYRWGWLAFNAGCSYGITGAKWAYAARGGVGTALSTWGAGAFGLFYSMFLHKGKVDVYEIISAVIASLSKLLKLS
jgi:ammonia channel protein AmtB